MKKIWMLFALLMPTIVWAQNQEVTPCAHTEQTHKLMMKYPFLKKNIEKAAEQLEEETAQRAAKSRGSDEVYIIPVVFHIVHNGGSENISDEQVYSAIEFLNTDFRLLNEDIANAPDVFQDIAADIMIEFRLAQIDPDGDCTKGINRVQSVLTYDGFNDELKSLIYWPRESYMNVWVVAESGTAAGWTFLPSTVDSPWMEDEDGIVMRSDYTGGIGTSSPGRAATLTHECGHWLNLMHTWGGGNSPGEPDNCFMDDNVADTPLTTGTSGGCNILAETCGSLDNINNHMEYTSCRYMFTQGQRDRMRAAAESTIADRNNLWSEENLIATGVFLEEELVCQAIFYTNRNEVCEGDSITFTDDSYHGITSWEWNFGDGTIVTGTDPDEMQNIKHAYDEEGSYTVSLMVGDGVNFVNTIENNVVTILPGDVLGDELVESFENGLQEEVWANYNVNGDEEWETTSSASYEGDECLRIRNRFVTVYDAIDEIISGTFDMSANTEIVVNYKWAFAQKLEETDDRLKVLISKDCGQTWSLKEVHRGMTDLPTAEPQNNTFVPDTGEWAENTFIVDDPEWMTSSFRVKFEFSGRGGNNIYLDAINIGGLDVISVDENIFSALVSIYPNPATDELTVEMNNLNGDRVVVDLLDVTGRIIQNVYNQQGGQKSQRIVVERGDLSSGMYFLRIAEGEKVLNKRVLFK
ncbi:MAG: M43 family zinc metalloprotease [Saprospiraceae bacterium]